LTTASKKAWEGDSIVHNLVISMGRFVLEGNERGN
jgi:hypothetical protein